MYLLDTNMISDLVKNPLGQVMKRIKKVDAKNICTSVIVTGEVLFGLEDRGGHRLKKNIEDVLASIPILPLQAPADQHYGRIRADFKRQGKPIGPNDLWIAAHALALGAVLVTANEKEFSRVPGLKIENWLRQ
jgi:tRNA(fMet)-specific endonuclease VapC